MKKLLLMLSFGLFIAPASAQLWVEDFTGEMVGAASGTAAGSSGGPWATTYSGLGSWQKNTVAVIGDVFEAVNLGSEAVFTTNVVDISGVGYAIINVDVYSELVESNDYVRMSYVLDGVETQFYELIGGNAGLSIIPAKPASAVVAGSSLQLKIYIKNDFNLFLGNPIFDYYYIDNITITSAPVIYSRKSGSWNDVTPLTGTWSLTGYAGVGCGCVPLNTQVALIGNSNTVTVPASLINIGIPPLTDIAPGAIDISSNGVLQFNTNSTKLGVRLGLLRVRNTGTVNSSSGAVVGEQILFDANVGGASLQVDAGGSVNVETLALGPSATSTHIISGAGALNISDDILIDGTGGTLINNFTGTFTLADRVEFQSGVTGATFVNNQPLTASTVYFDDDNNTFTNNSTLTLTDIQTGAGDNGNVFNNTVGKTLNLGSITLNNADLTLNNAGTINQTGNFNSMDVGSSFVNQSTGTWNWSLTPNATFDIDIINILDCTPTGNLFNYSGAGAQTILNTAYNNLTLSNSGAKSTSATLNVGSNLLASNAATLSPGANAIAVGGNVTIQNTASIGGTGSVAVGGDWSAVNAASYVEGTRSTTFNGASQAINNASGTETFYALTLSGSGTKSSTSLIDIDNNISIAGTTQLNVANDINLAGNWTVTSTNANPFVEGTNTVTLDGAGAQAISTVLGTGETFYNLSVTGAGVKSNNSLTNITNNLSLGGTATTQLSGSGNITVGGNWNVTSTNADPFVEASRAVTFNGSAPQTINTVLAAGEQFYDLTIFNTSLTSPLITLNKPVAVLHTLAMSAGIVQTTSTNLLTLKDNVTSNIGSATSYVDGPVQFDMAAAGPRTLNFPIGKAGDFGGVALRVAHTNGTAFSYTAEVIASSAVALSLTLATGTDKVSSVRYWDITRGLTASPLITNNTLLTTSGANAPGLTLNYVANDGVNQTGNLTIVKTIGASPTSWSNIGGSASGSPSGTVSSTVPSTNFQSFSLFTLANLTGGTNPLPVELVYFQATADDDIVKTQWQTAIESGNAFFNVERSINIESFSTVGDTISGHGTSLEKHTYTLDDPDPIFGRSYYRLKQTDSDKNVSYSPLVTVDYGGPEFPSLRVFPNPGTGKTINIHLTGLKQQRSVPIQIINAQGKVVYDDVVDVEIPGTLKHEIVFGSSLATGIYIVRAGSTVRLTRTIMIE